MRVPRSHLQSLQSHVPLPPHTITTPIHNLPPIPMIVLRVSHRRPDAIASIDIVEPTPRALIHNLDILGEFLGIRVPDADEGATQGVVVGVTGPVLRHEGGGEGNDEFGVGVVGPACGGAGRNLVVGHFAFVGGNEGSRKGEGKGDGEVLRFHD